MTNTRGEAPQALYHYTDAAGLLGILGDPIVPPHAETADFDIPSGTLFGTLWATDARYLNDSKELIYGAQPLADKLLDEAKAPKRTNLASSYLQELATDVLESRFEVNWHPAARRAVPYVTCFCKSGDLLSQWRGYGDSGGGYAIGFDHRYTGEFVHVEGAGLADYNGELVVTSRPQEVIYGGDEAENLLAASASTVADSVDHDIANLEEKELKTFLGAYRMVFLDRLAKIKHEAFKEETEYRIIVNDIGVGKPDFRAGRFGLIPYIKLYFPLAINDHPVVKEIVVGPGGDRELRKESLESFLRAIGSPGTKVRLSDAPFRG